MDEIERVYKEYPSYNKSYQFDELDDLLKEDFGTKINSKEENGFIDIEYNNRMGQYKAKLLIEYFKQNKEFYQYFLKRCKKIVISLANNTSSDELYISNYPSNIDTETILEQILTPLEQRRFLSPLSRKLDKKSENLLSQAESLKLVKSGILKNMLDGKQIDFFDYIDLVDGKQINLDYYYENAIVDIAFNKGCYYLLEQYMNFTNKEDIKNFQNTILFMLHEQYSIILFNELLSNQAKLLETFSKENNDVFLAKNISILSNFFYAELSRVYARYYGEDNEDREILKVSREEVINLVVEFLNEIDSTNNLSKEFITNLNKGIICLWDNSNTELRKEMMEKCSKFGYKTIDEAVCLSFFNKDEKLKNLLVNVPLTYTLEDVWTTIHEFFHFHSYLSSGKMPQNQMLRETSSICFEEKAIDFLLKKGYDKKNININFRIQDAFYNFNRVGPIMTYLSKYMENGSVTVEMMNEIIMEAKSAIAEECLQRGLSTDETRNEFKRQGFYGDIEDIRKNIILNMNCILLMNRRSIFSLTPYLIGTIISNNARENGIKVEDILKLSEEINNISDISSVMNMVGIDLNKYGINSSVGINR